jgi:hypothetical protein
MAGETNLSNPPAAIAAACERALAWVEDPKLRKQIEQHIEQLSETNKA